MIDRPLCVASIADFPEPWRWIEPLYDGEPPIDFRFFRTPSSKWINRLPGLSWGRIGIALHLRGAIRRGGIDLIASSMPRLSHYTSAIAQPHAEGVPHLATGFNFTDLPTGMRLDAMRRSFAHIDRFGVFSRMERDLYARLFDLPVERFHFDHWGVAPPIAAPLPRAIAEPYVVAIGGEARDYETLAAVARRLPKRRFVAVVRPHSFQDIDVPPNLTIMVNLPWDQTWSLAAHADAMAIPLRSSDTPNGIVTIVGAAHLGKAMVVTDSSGIRDYLTHEQNSLLVPVQDAAVFAAAIERLWDEPDLRRRLGKAAQCFAQTHCSEEITMRAAIRHIRELTGRA